MIRPEHLNYFKDLLEGRATISWQAWFKRNAESLQTELPRAVYLRLKFQNLDEAEKLLRESGIEFLASPQAKRERQYAQLHPSVLDENGRPLESFQRKAYNGAFGAFMDDQPEKGNALLRKFLAKINRGSSLKRGETLGDMCFDGQMELQLGNELIGRSILELIAELETGDDLIDPAIFRARELLNLPKL